MPLLLFLLPKTHRPSFKGQWGAPGASGPQAPCSECGLYIGVRAAPSHVLTVNVFDGSGAETSQTSQPNHSQSPSLALAHVVVPRLLQDSRYIWRAWAFLGLALRVPHPGAPQSWLPTLGCRETRPPRRLRWEEVALPFQEVGCLPLGLRRFCGRGMIILPSACGSWASGHRLWREHGQRDSRWRCGQGEVLLGSIPRMEEAAVRKAPRCLLPRLTPSLCTGSAVSVSFRPPASNLLAHFRVLQGTPTGTGKLTLQMLRASSTEVAQHEERGPGRSPEVTLPSGSGFLHLWGEDTPLRSCQALRRWNPLTLPNPTLEWPCAGLRGRALDIASAVYRSGFD